ncbi:MAG TPA: flagellin [Tepidisphaeraceae bacterium]|jgi:flagellar hook-associated protein 3 FlgL
MSITSINFARASDLLRFDSSSRQIDNTQQQLLQVQQEISTGNRINDPSDDPGNASIIIGLQQTSVLQTQYLANVQQSQSQLNQADSSLNGLNSLVTQATTIASQSVGSDVTAAQRQANAQVVASLYNQTLSIANTQFEGSYIFGGSRSTQQPYVSVAGGVQFVGSTQVLQNTANTDTNLDFQISATSVFGRMNGVNGSADLTPALTPTTRISDLRGASGNGVHLGTIQIGNGTTTKSVDLSNADTIQDVVNDINNAAVGNVTASIQGNHLLLSTTGADNITVTDAGSGTAAADLGIGQQTGAGAGVAVTGTSVQPNVTALTPISALNDGAGIDTTHGLIITNGQKSATLNFSSATTVGDLLNQINASGTDVRAQVNAAGTGIDILNTIQGTSLTIGENGGTTAADLGVRSFSASTALSSLNGGRGVGTASNGGADFQITRSDGTSFSVSIAGATTVQDVINDINTASGGVGITASFATTGNGIVLTDTAGGGGTPSVTALNASTAAVDLGLTTPARGNVITGADVNATPPSGLFADLSALETALNNNDQAGITRAAAALQNDQQQLTATRGKVGAQTQELQSLQTSLQTQSTSTQALIAQIQGADMPSTISKFTQLQTALQASLEVAAQGMNLSLMNFLS